MSGVFAAAGMLSADVEHNFVHAAPRRLTEITVGWITERMDLLAQTGRAALSGEGYDEASIALSFFADVRYAGQSSELTVPLTCDSVSNATFAEITTRFRDEHRANFGYVTDEPIELANLRMTAKGQREDRLRFANIDVDEPASAIKSSAIRKVSFERDSGYCEVPLIQRAAVNGNARNGPAVIESYDTTILIPAGCTYRADTIGNIIIDVPPETSA
jgi:N-methylhydantoinase A